MTFLRVAALAAVCVLAGCSDDDPVDPAWVEVLDGEDLDRVGLSAWGPDADNVFVAGGGLGNGVGALALYYNGTDWAEINTGSADSFWWVWGTSANSVYFVGEQGAVYHYDGTTATKQTVPTTLTLYGAWGTADNDVWVVGGDPLADTAVILHYDGSDWLDVTPAGITIDGALFKVWGSGPNDIYAVGQNGIILHYDGADWTQQESNTQASLFTVHGNSAGDAWVVGGPPATVLQLGDSDWRAVTTGFPATVLNGVAVAENGDVLVVGMGGIKLRLIDNVWVDQTSNRPIMDLHGAFITPSGDDMYVVGGNFYAPGLPTTVRLGSVGYFGTEPPPSSL